ncbi:AcvB/VirJ family lysyl-phosphatidylglycerol hydrolase [uncultured Caulobacter sp.]|uniref:AcvB/VirJ family lysyl-phosphatidylglycerol hydrolase n=1 Tax=uncultured Caulobacter sp. TaxID=158749 RepID=UPI00261B8FEB|nr:AcvB/VirJ family lysyl-phosphatidylglycerol hydrolase [uncultured Caulobacter sp.]
MITPARLAAALAALALIAGAPPRAMANTLVPLASDKPGDTLAVFYSGDGGWGSLDADVARYLAANGVPTIGVNSLAYFRTKRSPEGAAEDLAAALREYGALWGRTKVVLVGYSFGADALPAIVPKLPDDIRAQVGHLVLIGTGPRGDLHFHPTSWLNIPARDSFPARPAITALTDLKITCVYGAKEHADICASLPDAQVAKVRLPGGHHFNGDYASLGDVVLKAIR